MSTLPPCSRGGMVRQASAAARSKSLPLSRPSSASLGCGGRASAGTWGAPPVSPPCAGMSPVTRSGLRSISACSRRFHSANRSAEGAQPNRPGWELPMNRTPGTCRELVQMPSRSQIALDAPGGWSVRKPPPFSLAKVPVYPPGCGTAVAGPLGEAPGVPPRLFVEGAHVDDVDDQKVAWLGALDGERPAQIGMPLRGTSKDENRGRSPVEPGMSLVPVSPSLRLAPGPLGTNNCRHEHECQSLRTQRPLGRPPLVNRREGLEMDVLVDRCAGLDVHKDTVMAVVRRPTPDGTGRTQEVRQYRTFTAALRELRAWLLAERVTQVAMEATGSSWKPVWHVLEAETGYELLLCNPRHVKNLPGRKTDVCD